MALPTVATLFANLIERRIEEVIKVDQNDETVLAEEFGEYVVTASIKAQMVEMLGAYDQVRHRATEGVGVWVSGFFGSGKSSFAKLVGLAMANRSVGGIPASELLAKAADDPKVAVLLKQITEHRPTDAVIFDVSTDRSVKGGDEALTRIVYRLFLTHLGYARDLDLAELEIALEGEGRLASFEAEYRNLYNKDWNHGKSHPAFAMNQASTVMNQLEPETFPSKDSWMRGAQHRADITAGMLADRCKQLMDRRRPGRNLVFVVDEVGQYVARDVQKMLDLQGIVKGLGQVGRGRFWIVVTSQEKLNELVAGLDDKRVELNRLMDRFPIQVHLEPADISEVTSRRVLAKNAAGQDAIGKLFDADHARLRDAVQLTADVRLDELTRARFVDLYPLLPYQVRLVIDVVSGLRTQSGSNRHVGGANRTIIKLAQQLLIHPQTNLAAKPLGVLATIEQIYDLVVGNIPSDLRGKIDDIPKRCDHPSAQAAAKAVCLLVYVKSIHRTPENIAALLHPAVNADSKLAEVKVALDELVKRRLLRLAEDGYRIPSPAEDDWERTRDGLDTRIGDENRIHAQTLESLWQPIPSHLLLDVRTFKGALFFNAREVVAGDVPFHLFFEKAGASYNERDEEVRKRSQVERSAVFWVGSVDDGVATATREVYRSSEILAKKERTALTPGEQALVAEEKHRLSRHQKELKRMLVAALMGGRVWFRGNERSPDGNTNELHKAAAAVLGKALPEVFHRFGEAAAKVTKKDLEALLKDESLRGLPGVFATLKLVRDQDGQTVFDTEKGPLAEVLAKIDNRTSYGEKADGRYLAAEFDKEPFGWDLDVVRLLSISLLRGGKIVATSGAHTIDNATSTEAKEAFPDNNRFRSASFRPRKGIDFATLVEAANNFKNTFGHEIAEIEEGAVVRAIRAGVGGEEETLRGVYRLLAENALPGADSAKSAWDQVDNISRGTADDTINGFNAAWHTLKDAFKRARELAEALTAKRVAELKRARQVKDLLAPFLQSEADFSPASQAHVERIVDILGRETFFRDFVALGESVTALANDFEARFDKANSDRKLAYTAALSDLMATPGWEQLTGNQPETVAAPLKSRTFDAPSGGNIPLLRADTEACGSRLAACKAELARIVDGNRAVWVKVSDHFKGGIEDKDALDTAMNGLRAVIEALIADNKKVHLS